MQEVTLTIPVKTNASVSPQEIAKVVQRLIDIGLADAASTIVDGGNNCEGDVEAAELATDLNIGAPVVAKESQAHPFVAKVAGLSIWDYDKDDGSPYEECEEPDDGLLDSHCCLMSLIEDARRIQEGQ